MKLGTNKSMVIVCTVCMLGILAAGCSSDSAPSAGTSANTADETPAADTEDQVAQDSEEVDQMPEEQENSEGRWHVLDPDIAAAVDADFEGMVRKVEEDCFFIVEVKTEFLDDGTLLSSSVASDADIPDSELIQVVFDEDTYFSMRTIYDGGERHEDRDAVPTELEKGVSVSMKGRFENDIFYADEIRMHKVV